MINGVSPGMAPAPTPTGLDSGSRERGKAQIFGVALRISWSAQARVLCADLHGRWVAQPFDGLVRVPSGHPVTLCYLGLADAVDRVVDREYGTCCALGAFRDKCAAICAGSARGAECRASRNAWVIGSIPIGGPAQRRFSLVSSNTVARPGRATAAASRSDTDVCW